MKRDPLEKLMRELVSEVRGLRVETMKGRRHTSSLFRDLHKALEALDRRVALLENTERK